MDFYMFEQDSAVAHHTCKMVAWFHVLMLLSADTINIFFIIEPG